jgi:tRNA modification GTPase
LRRQIGQRSIAGELPRVVLIGRPNVGKSSLFNALVGKPVAISFDAAGTTRDYLNETVCWEGQGIRLFDSAGIERGRALLDEVQRAPANASPDGHGDQSISRMAERTSRELVAEADLCIECVAAEDALDAVESSPLIESQRWLIAMTKSDLGGNACPRGALPTSAVTGSGIPELKAAIVSALRAGRGDVEVLPITAARCSEALEGTSAAISRALGALDDQHSEEFIAAELRVALENLGTVVGAIYNEDILDRVFSRFCIGK